MYNKIKGSKIFIDIEFDDNLTAEDIDAINLCRKNIFKILKRYIKTGISAGDEIIAWSEDETKMCRVKIIKKIFGKEGISFVIERI